jgi:plastocyanin
MISWNQITALSTLLVLVAIIAGCASTNGMGTAQPTPALPSGMTNVVAIKDFAFSPSTLTIKAGDTVSWVNQGSAPHTVVSDSGSPVKFQSAELQTGASYSFTFSKPGTYPYYCSVHPSMTATIVVES